MNSKFDELTKSMAQSVTRRQALKKFGVGLAGLALAGFGLANKAKATDMAWYNLCMARYCSKYKTGSPDYIACSATCKRGHR